MLAWQRKYPQFEELGNEKRFKKFTLFLITWIGRIADSISRGQIPRTKAWQISVNQVRSWASRVAPASA